MLIDTHCHIYLEDFDKDIDEVLTRAVEAGVAHIFMPAINYGSIPQMDTRSHEKIRFHKMAGIHPTEINEGVQTSEDELTKFCSDPEVLGVGETGLDYYWSEDYKQEQQESLHLHCKVGKAIQKPVILHNRESTDDLLNVIEQEQDGSLSGIWHCFNGTVDEGKRAIDLGLLLGIGGVLTFKNAGVDEVVAKLPLDKMVLETDAPYLAPSPYRGSRNEPSFIAKTAKRLSEVMEVRLEVIEEKTSKTALSLFDTAAS